MKNTKNNKIVVAITGASGAIYANLLLKKLDLLQQKNSTTDNTIEEISIVMSDNAKDVWKQELGNSEYGNIPFKIYNKSDFFAPFASGSSNYNIMIICPCSMGTLGRIANGISNDLTTRAADVILKERRKLILVTRDTPLNLIHINNMKTVTEAGGIICPASPSFYSMPKTIEELANTVVDRIIDLCDIPHNTYRWGNQK